MRRLPRGPVGVPIKQVVSIKSNDEADNFYLLKMEVVDESVKDRLAFKAIYHLFTAKELMEATTRYYRHMDDVIERDIKTMIGYTYPITYSNQNGCMTTRWFVRFDSSRVDGMEPCVQCGMFSAREMRRSKARCDYIVCTGDSWFTRILKGIRAWRRRPEET